MEGRSLRTRATIILSVSALALVFLSTTGHSEAYSAIPGSDVELLSNVLFIVQGENDITVGTESSDDFYVLQIADFELPYDEQKVYMNIPRDARSINVWESGTPSNQSSYAWEQVGGNELFAINVPQTFARTAEYTNTTDSQSEFSTLGSEFTNTSYYSGALRLSANQTSGKYVSTGMRVPQALSLDSANVTVAGAGLANISIEASNDNGTTWMSCLNSQREEFVSDGSMLKFRLSFAGNASVTSVKIVTGYVALAMKYTVHVSYLWTAEFIKRSAVLDLTSAHELDEDASCHLLLYVLKGYTASGSGLNLTLDPSSYMNPYTDKDLYLNASFRPEPGSGASIEIVAPEQAQELWPYAVAAAVAVGAGGVALYSLRSRRSARRRDAEARADTESSEEVAGAVRMTPAEIEARRKELVGRKKELLSEVEDVRARASKGQLTQSEANAELLRLKGESKAIRNELNRLSRKAASAEGQEIVDVDDYDSVLAAVARIDDDFEKGRLPKETHERLRKEYVDKAKRILAARDAMELAGTTPGESEKAKLMEAIAALDDEHGRGEIGDKLYNDLRASYKRQLSELLRKSDESKEN